MAISKQTMGERGGVVVSGSATAEAGVYRVLQVINEVVITNIEINGISAADEVKLETTIGPGVYLFGLGITAYTQSSGLAYLAE